MLVALWVLEHIPCPVVEHVEGEGPAEKWHQSVLLELIVPDCHGTQAVWADALSLLGVLDRNIKRGLLPTEG
jgi:hypothetical protein